MHRYLIIVLLTYCSVCKGQLSHWQSLPFNINEAQASLHVDTNNNVLYIAGLFSKVNGSDGRIIRWDGSSYTIIPAAPQLIIGPMLNYKGKLYTAGNRGLARYDGTSWEILDSFNHGINCLYQWGDKLICAGSFDQICGHQFGNAAVFDGDTSWTDLFQVDTLLEIKSHWEIGDIAEYKGELYIAGNLNPNGKPTISEIARFDGHHWKDVGGGIQAGGLAAVSQMLIWKGDMYVCGEFSEADGAPGNCIVRWDGTNWHRLNGGMPFHMDIVNEMAVYHDNLYVVGYFTQADGIKANSIAKWDGSKWCSLGDSANNFIFNIVNFKDELYVWGPFTSINNDTSYRYFAKWTGKDYVAECSLPLEVKPELLPESFNIYPNPVSGDKLIVTYSGAMKFKHLTVTVASILGERIIQREFSFAGGGADNTIDVSKLPKGVYLIHLTTDLVEETKKVVVQ